MSCKIKLMVVMLVASLCVAACSRDKERAKQAAPGKPTETAKRRVEPLPPPPEFIPVTGKVLEILDTGSFLYVSLDWNGKQVWAAVPGVDLKVGEVISLDHATMLEKGFRSDTLKRTFEKIIMASGVEGRSPRSRVANSSNSNDPKNRRSGKITVVPSPAPPLPSKKVAVKTG